MKSLIDKRNLKDGEVNVTTTNTYIEVEIPSDSSSSLFVYLIPRSQTSLFVATCWEHAFDELFNNIDEDDWETVVDTWPTLARLLNNGVNDRYKEGALIKLEDLDDGENKWFVASISGNHNFDDVDDILNESTQETMKLVIECSMQLAAEMQDKEPSALRAMGRGLGKGLAAGIGTVAVGALAAFLGLDTDDFSV